MGSRGQYPNQTIYTLLQNGAAIDVKNYNQYALSLFVSKVQYRSIILETSHNLNWARITIRPENETWFEVPNDEIYYNDHTDFAKGN